MSTDAGAPDLAELRERVDKELAALLRPRRPDAVGRVLGAGSDDFDSGRRYLAALAPGWYAVPTWPTEHGGMGLDRDAADVVAEVLRGYEAPDMYPFLVGIDLIGPTLLAHATEEQKARWLPPMRSGDEIWCQMFSEPDAGSDLANVKARAVRDGDVWRISGSKVWTSRAHYAQWGLLVARTDPSVPKHAGISAFAVDFSLPGVEVRPLVQMNGDAHFNEVFLDEVAVPAADMVGELNDGWRVAITCLSFERGSLAGDLGISLDRLKALAARHDLAHRPVERDRWARAVVTLRVAQMTAQRAQAARRAGHRPGPEDSGAKLRTNRMLS
ncbi:MAG: acyl-CoA dehydrogenase family protein, partial [Acidimicrobiales bacterium]